MSNWILEMYHRNVVAMGYLPAIKYNVVVCGLAIFYMTLPVQKTLFTQKVKNFLFYALIAMGYLGYAIVDIRFMFFSAIGSGALLALFSLLLGRALLKEKERWIVGVYVPIGLFVTYFIANLFVA